MTKAELFALFPASGNAEMNEARGRFLSAVRLFDALVPVALLNRFDAWIRRRRTAQALDALPEATLRDIGLTRGEIGHAAAASAMPRAPRDGPAARLRAGIPQLG